jgi:hypothetical protein
MSSLVILNAGFYRRGPDPVIGFGPLSYSGRASSGQNSPKSNVLQDIHLGTNRRFFNPDNGFWLAGCWMVPDHSEILYEVGND